MANQMTTPNPENSHPNVPGDHVSPNIILGTDGKYHWYYEFPLLKNPTILFLIWKIFFWIILGIWAFMLLLDVFSGDLTMDRFLDIGKFFLLFLLGFEVLAALGYLVYAAIMGWKYRVIFEMDEKRLRHIVLPKQMDKAKGLAILTVLAGLSSKSPAVVGTGMLSATKSESISPFQDLDKLVIIKRRNLIKLNERFEKNQAYAEGEDFDFVASWIKERVSKKCKVIEK